MNLTAQRITNLTAQIAQLNVMKHAAQSFLHQVTVAHDETLAYVVALDSHIARLRDQLNTEIRTGVSDEALPKP